MQSLGIWASPDGKESALILNNEKVLRASRECLIQALADAQRWLEKNHDGGQAEYLLDVDVQALRDEAPRDVDPLLDGGLSLID